jgi:hypothetical protein
MDGVYSSVVVLSEARMADMRGPGIAQWFRRSSGRPCGLVVDAFGWYRSRRAVSAGRNWSSGLLECVANWVCSQDNRSQERSFGETMRPSG